MFSLQLIVLASVAHFFWGPFLRRKQIFILLAYKAPNSVSSANFPFSFFFFKFLYIKIHKWKIWSESLKNTTYT